VRRRPFGSTGLELPVLGQGTWTIERGDRREAVRALRRGFELGMTHVDTAEMYGDGRAEEVVGEALRGWKGEVFVASKVLPQNASRTGTVAACERSLRRLGRERIELYLLHWPGAHPLEDTVAGFEELVAAGKVGAWGVSNFDADELARTVAIGGSGGVACDQVLYHLEERAIEHRVVPRCAELGVAVVAYSPFGSDTASFPPGGQGGRRALLDLARELGATPRQIVLAFLTRHPSVFAIPKAASVAHVEENAAAGDLVLGEEGVRRLEQAFPLGREPRELPTI